MLTGTELGDALRRAMAAKGVRQIDVARHFGVKPPSVKDWLDHGRIGKQHIDRLIEYFSDVVPYEHWGLNRPLGLIEVAQSGSGTGSMQRPSRPTDHLIPLLDSRASMGDGVPLVDHVNVVEMVAANLPELRSRVSFTAPGNLRLLTGYGDSMSPTFNDGDVLLIDVGVTDLKLDAVYVLERQDQLYVKRIQRRPTGALRMISDNPVYPPEDIDPEADGFAVLARVLCVWNFRKL